MKKIQFTSKLLSDVIINQKAATEGNQTTLDFIPGSSWLGVAAGTLYRLLNNEESFLVFHSGKVRFGDAHPLYSGKESGMPVRASRIPAAWYTQKNKKTSDGVFIAPPSAHGPAEVIQYKQCRSGFVVKTSDGNFLEIDPARGFAVKSAYDSSKRRAEDEKMYGYESLSSGSLWGFEVEFDEDVPDSLALKVKDALTGMRRIGRSSTAQYGLVDISAEPFSLPCETIGITEPDNNDGFWIYAESRLIFTDKDGLPLFLPAPGQLGLKNGKVCLEKSRIRFFQYAPFNNTRMTRDPDRCGIEKGSVFFVSGASQADVDMQVATRGVGSFLNEGFGKILVNPFFLEADKLSSRLKGNVVQQDKEMPPKDPVNPDLNKFTGKEKLLLQYLQEEREMSIQESRIFDKVNQYFSKAGESGVFQNEAFAAQWGTIRSLAVRAKSKEDLGKQLFEIPDDRKGKKGGYLMHGVAKDKWEGRPLKMLKNFFDSLEEDIAIPAVINLAAEMAKKSKRR